MPLPLQPQMVTGGVYKVLHEKGNISPLANLTNLTTLYLNGNGISEVEPLASLANLTVLYLNNNGISDLSYLSGLTGLARLYLYSNQISDIEPLVDNAGISSGDEVDLSDNALLRSLSWPDR